MKLEDILFEGPYHIGQDAPMWSSDAFMSDSSLAREYDNIGTLQRPGQSIIFTFWIGKSRNVAVITTPDVDDIGQPKNRVAVHLIFKNTNSKLPVKNELQVDSVRASNEVVNMGLAGALYIVLARYGFTIVSDFTQYNGGKALWKKLARESEARKYVVRVWDDEVSDWIKDTTGVPIKYNAANLVDEQVWKDISQHNESTTLLALSSV
jgi:hypothetical protein